MLKLNRVDDAVTLLFSGTNFLVENKQVDSTADLLQTLVHIQCTRPVTESACRMHLMLFNITIFLSSFTIGTVVENGAV